MVIIQAWIFQAEHYFEFYEIAENYKLSLASLYLDGKALEWYQWLFRNKQLADWKHFTAKVMIRFRKQHLESQRCHLANSQQITSVIDVFDEMSTRVFTKEVEETSSASSFVPVLDDIQSPKVFDEISHTIVSSEINDLNTIAHEGEDFATTVAKVGNDSFSEDVSLQTKVPTTMLVDTKESNTEEEDNPRDNVVLFDKCPKRDTSDSLVPFPSQGVVMPNVSMRIAAIEYPYDNVLWYNTIPCLHNSLEDMCGGKQTRVSPYLDFSLHKCNWVDTGQECNLSSFLSSKPKGCASEEKIQKVLQAIYVSSSKHSPYIQVVRLIVAMYYC